MQKSERILRIIMSVILPVAMLLLAKEAAVVRAEYVARGIKKDKFCVIIDVGHGGHDPGKVGVTGCYEKDINLEIANYLKVFLEFKDVEVVLTRDGDYGLCHETDANKKTTDMKNRVKKIKEIQPDLVVSIHQNSYSDGSIWGAQTFYYSGDVESLELAKFLQESLIDTLNTKNKRKEKANDSYYLLKNTDCPCVIVECGFLSNYEECTKLESAYYQEKVAWSVHMGIMKYFNSK